MRFFNWYAIFLIFTVQIIAGCGGGGAAQAPPVTEPTDKTAPNISSFTLPTTSTSLTVSISSLTATDNVGVTGYLVTESPAFPAATVSGWTATAPTSFIFSSFGTKTAYAWAKDAAGNISLSRSATVIMFITSTINTVVSNPTAISTISISGISDPIICGIDLQVTYPNGTNFINGTTSGVTLGSILSTPIIGQLAADVTIFGTDGFGSGEVAKINFATVPPGTIPTNFGVTILKVFNCSGSQIQ
ncbi:MAG TPA: hypothetical protein HPP97_13080 [Desulfuromonadales bacterium]|nr:hypothetical protein [Desulfuromonadales bacterium]